MTIADRIQQLRKQNGLSQEQLAERLDVSRQAVSKWESGQSIPDVDICSKEHNRRLPSNTPVMHSFFRVQVQF